MFNRVDKGMLILDAMVQLGTGKYFEHVMYPTTFDELPADCQVIVLEQAFESLIREHNSARLCEGVKKIMDERAKRANATAPRVERPFVEQEPKFKVGQRVRITDRTRKHHGYVGTVKSMKDGYYPYEITFGDGLDDRLFHPSEIELVEPDPAPGAFLSIEEDRELVAMGLSLWQSAGIREDFGSAPIGSIANGLIKFQVSGDAKRDWRDLEFCSPRNNQHLTDAARALLRRVRDERKSTTPKEGTDNDAS